MKYINDNKDSIKRDIGLDITSTVLEQGGINEVNSVYLSIQQVE